MLKPRALRPGDRIGIVAPASPFRREEFEAGLAELRRLGFEPVYEPSVFDRDGYVAGSPEARAAAIGAALADPSVGAVMAVRGGYGSVHLLPLLDGARMRRTPKAFIGYSDTTSLLTWLTLGCGIVGFHGPMLEGRLARGDVFGAGHQASGDVDEGLAMAALDVVRPELFAAESAGGERRAARKIAPKIGLPLHSVRRHD